MPRILFFVFCFTNSLLCQNIYFQHYGKLYINNQIVEIKYQNNTYNIYDGVVSPNGNFICGYLLDEKLNNFIKIFDGGGIVDFFGLDSLHLVIYDRQLNNIIFESFDRSFCTPYFSGDEKYILVSYWPGNISKLVNLHTGTVEYNFPDTCQDFKWIKGDLYFFREVNNSYELLYFEIEKKKTVFINKISNDLWKNRELRKTEILDKDRILILSKDSVSYYLTIVYKKLVNKEIKFHFVTEVTTSNNNDVFIVGAQKDEPNNGELYNLDLDQNSLQMIFTIQELEDNLNEGPIPIISDIFLLDDEYYFIVNYALPEDDNIIKFNSKNLSFSKLTEKGYISEPIGYFK